MILRLSSWIQRHSVLFQALLFLGIIGSFPFVAFPLTDGDIAHWVGIAKHIQLYGQFLSCPQDQSHGPFLFWTSGLLTRIRPDSLYFYNLSNLICGLIGIGWMYYYGTTKWRDKRIGHLAVVVAATSIVWLYLSRTPMYDWPAAIFYFGFCVHVVRYLDTAKANHAIAAAIALSIGATSRFSIVIGLGLCFASIAFLIRKKPLRWILLHLALFGLAGVVLSLPWLVVQTKVHGIGFRDTFIYDNVGRYIREPGHGKIYHDYYGFVLYTIVGLIPYSFLLMASLFQRAFWQRLRTDTEQWLLAAGWLPCLLIFSFSGHVKLGRYIAYVFPMLILFMAYNVITFDIKTAAYRRLAGRMTGVVLVIMTVLLGIVANNNRGFVIQSPWFALSSILLVVGTLGTTWFTVSKYPSVLSDSPQRLLPVFALIYGLFFIMLSTEYQRADFLLPVRRSIYQSIYNGSQR